MREAPTLARKRMACRRSVYSLSMVFSDLGRRARSLAVRGAARRTSAPRTGRTGWGTRGTSDSARSRRPRRFRPRSGRRGSRSLAGCRPYKNGMLDVSSRSDSTLAAICVGDVVGNSVELRPSVGYASESVPCHPSAHAPPGTARVSSYMPTSSPVEPTSTATSYQAAHFDLEMDVAVVAVAHVRAAEGEHVDERPVEPAVLRVAIEPVCADVGVQVLFRAAGTPASSAASGEPESTEGGVVLPSAAGVEASFEGGGACPSGVPPWLDPRKCRRSSRRARPLRDQSRAKRFPRT